MIVWNAIYEQKRKVEKAKELGHASVVTTEINVKFCLRRLEADFPSLMNNAKISEIPISGHEFTGRKHDASHNNAVVF